MKIKELRKFSLKEKLLLAEADLTVTFLSSFA